MVKFFMWMAAFWHTLESNPEILQKCIV